MRLLWQAGGAADPGESVQEATTGKGALKTASTSRGAASPPPQDGKAGEQEGPSIEDAAAGVDSGDEMEDASHPKGLEGRSKKRGKQAESESGDSEDDNDDHGRSARGSSRGGIAVIYSAVEIVNLRSFCVVRLFAVVRINRALQANRPDDVC